MTYNARNQNDRRSLFVNLPKAIKSQNYRDVNDLISINQVKLAKEAKIRIYINPLAKNLESLESEESEVSEESKSLYYLQNIDREDLQYIYSARQENNQNANGN